MAVPSWDMDENDIRAASASSAQNAQYYAYIGPPAGQGTQAPSADSSNQPIIDAGHASYMNPLQQYMPQTAVAGPQHSAHNPPIRLPTVQQLSQVLAAALTTHCGNDPPQSSTNLDVLAAQLAIQLHLTFENQQTSHETPAPSTVHYGYSDADTDASWTAGLESGKSGEYFDALNEGIQRIKGESGGHVLSTPLAYEDRRLVHWMARQSNRSHATIGDGKLRRVLIWADAIVPTFRGNNRRRASSWSRRGTIGHYVVPNGIIIQHLPHDVTLHDVTDAFRVLGLPIPKRLELADNTSSHHAEAEFDNADEVADVVAKLQGKTLRQGDKIPLRFQYQRKPVEQRTNVEQHGFNLLDGNPIDVPVTGLASWSQDPVIYTTNLSHSFNTEAGVSAIGNANLPGVIGATNMVPTLQSPVFNFNATLQTPRTPFPSFSQSPQALYDQRSNNRPLNTARHLSVPSVLSKRPSSGASSDEGGHSEYLSATEGSAASGSGSSRRRRNPRIVNGYPCGKELCEQSFDTQGECTKHRRNHLPIDQRPFPCVYCSLAFLDSRDLRRHLKAGHKLDTATAVRVALNAKPRVQPPPDWDQPDSAGPTLRVPDDRISNNGASSPYTQGSYTPYNRSQEQSPTGVVNHADYPGMIPDSDAFSLEI